MGPYSVLCCSDMLVGAKVRSCQVDVVEVALEPKGQSTFGLTNVLFVTNFTGDAVNEVRTFAAHIEFTGKGELCHGTSNGTTSIDEGTISAFG